MAEDTARGQQAGRAGGTPPELAEEERTRPAWAKPAMHRFSLQRTLAGSGVASDTIKPSSAFPT